MALKGTAGRKRTASGLSRDSRCAFFGSAPATLFFLLAFVCIPNPNFHKPQLPLWYQDYLTQPRGRETPRVTHSSAAGAGRAFHNSISPTPLASTARGRRDHNPGREKKPHHITSP